MRGGGRGVSACSVFNPFMTEVTLEMCHLDIMIPIEIALELSMNSSNIFIKNIIHILEYYLNMFLIYLSCRWSSVEVKHEFIKFHKILKYEKKLLFKCFFFISVVVGVLINFSKYTFHKMILSQNHHLSTHSLFHTTCLRLLFCFPNLY